MKKETAKSTTCEPWALNRENLKVAFRDQKTRFNAMHKDIQRVEIKVEKQTHRIIKILMASIFSYWYLENKNNNKKFRWGLTFLLFALSALFVGISFYKEKYVKKRQEDFKNNYSNRSTSLAIIFFLPHLAKNENMDKLTALALESYNIETHGITSTDILEWMNQHLAPRKLTEAIKKINGQDQKTTIILADWAEKIFLNIEAIIGPLNLEDNHIDDDETVGYGAVLSDGDYERFIEEKTLQHKQLQTRHNELIEQEKQKSLSAAEKKAKACEYELLELLKKDEDKQSLNESNMRIKRKKNKIKKSNRKKQETSPEETQKLQTKEKPSREAMRLLFHAGHSKKNGNDRASASKRKNNIASSTSPASELQRTSDRPTN